MRNSVKAVVLFNGGIGRSDDFNRADGAIGNGWSGPTWTISGNKAINTPSVGSEALSNGTFASDTVWNKGTGWTIAAGIGSYAGVHPATGDITQPILSQKFYRASIDISTLTNALARTVADITNTDGTATGTVVTHIMPVSGTVGVQATTVSGSAVVAIDNASFKPVTLADMFCTYETKTANYDAFVDLTCGAGGITAGIVLALDSATNPQNFAIAFHRGGANGVPGGGAVEVIKCVNGVIGQVLSQDVPYVAGATLRFRKRAFSTCVVTYNGVNITGNFGITDPSIIYNTRHGIFSMHPSYTLDNFIGVPAP